MLNHVCATVGIAECGEKEIRI